MKRKLVAALLVAVLGIIGFAPAPAGAASSIYGIHVYRPTAGYQGVLQMSLNALPDVWSPAYTTAAARISNASGVVQVYTTGCSVGRACAQPRLYQGGSSGKTYVDYKINSNAHLVLWEGAYTGTTNLPYINGDLPQTSASRVIYACDAIMQQLGVKDGCRLDGYPSQEGLNILAYVTGHTH